MTPEEIRGAVSRAVDAGGEPGDEAAYRQKVIAEDRRRAQLEAAQAELVEANRRARSEP